MRVLHLEGRSPGFCAERTSKLLQHAAIPGVEIVRQPFAGGLGPALFRSLPSLRRIAGEFDAVHVWDICQLLVAAQAGARKIIYSLAEMPAAGEFRWLPWIIRRWPVHVVCDAESRRQKFIARGLAADRCHAIAAGVEVTQRQVDKPLRQELGLADDELVVLAPGESTHAAGHRFAIWATAILQVLDRRWRAIIWGRGSQTDRVAGLVAGFGQADLLCVAERKLGRRIEFERLLGVADFALLTPGDRAPVLPAALCAASGLPIVRWPQEALDEVIPRNAVAASVPRRRPAQLAQELMGLAENRSACDLAIENALQHARSSLSIDRFAQSYRDLYCGK